MKIGVLTFHFVYNYGAMLQAYALSQYLNKQDSVECELIDYRPRKIDCIYHPDWQDFYAHPKVVLKNYVRKKISHTDVREFERFMGTYFRMSKCIKSDQEFEKILGQYDTVFVGSDQVWNPMITGYDKNYLLQNTTKELHKFSYAASIGMNDADDEWKYSLKMLSMFEGISVREESAYKLIKSIMPERDIQRIVDPVFLFSADIWRKLEKRVADMSRYLLFYSLSNNENLKKKAEKISRLSGLRIISIHPLYRSGIGKCRCDIGPGQFLWLIDHAEHICTDSFHAVAFSAILSKKVSVQFDFKRGNRICDLLERLGEKSEIDFEEIGSYNFDNTYTKIKELENEGKKYIMKCI